ncbi:cytochrome P450 [Kribbella sandramycini]|uniref:Cytochrome P450 n=1 Tax=Kribbella sandramycini TaxID=60450 RepID=A0A7Y4NZ54_9ACTN|nr:cytochrome P450 [Kribbella sandramycini]NOL39634.1 cytochrome P450 [Kribbella sandramycini]
MDELLRYLFVLDALPARIATQDIEIAGMTIKAGDGVIIANSIVCRDSAAFAEPELAVPVAELELRDATMIQGVDTPPVTW